MLFSVYKYNVYIYIIHSSTRLYNTYVCMSMCVCGIRQFSKTKDVHC